ncbi:hypothetical protein SRED_002294 [Spiroplasma melliferum]|uniref:Uncharacterized protein n=1 Tax=Spiroplasma melliferum TaxID=2134 RepID=A0ABX5UAM1_SPIME|nr:hypothetical protein [Spiroplasma melliferum]QCO23440.1 hypothetical protein SRED_001909 [Spiroplasma melliferum]QCO23820.1 hypothetical protein SRED_002294 [Spiroplasma melliferum]
MEINNIIVSFLIDNADMITTETGAPHPSICIPIFKDDKDIHVIRLTTQKPKEYEKLVIKINGRPDTKLYKDCYVRLDGSKSNFHIIKENNCLNYKSIYCQNIHDKYRKKILQACLNSKFIPRIFHPLIQIEINKFK